LYLIVTPNGGKWWRFKYRFGGKEKCLSFGVYPDVGLKSAREKRDETRKLVAAGSNPSENRKAIKQANAERGANSFEVLAREWLDKFKDKWTEGHREGLLQSFEKNVFPWLGNRPIAEIKAPELLSILRRIENRGANETAHRVKSSCSQVFLYAIATGRAERNPASDLTGALVPVRAKHLAAITDPKEVGQLLRDLDGYQGGLIVSCALKMAPLVFVRPGELRSMKWEDIDFEKAEWRYFVTKTKTDHIVPLSKQALDILKEIHPLTGAWPYVFPSANSRTRPMSDNAILTALRRCGIEKEKMSGHGFRAMARTILDEVLKFRVDVIEHQLAHAVKDPNGRTYNRTSHGGMYFGILSGDKTMSWVPSDTLLRIFERQLQSCSNKPLLSICIDGATL
jgi:integrase